MPPLKQHKKQISRYSTLVKEKSWQDPFKRFWVGFRMRLVVTSLIAVWIGGSTLVLWFEQSIPTPQIDSIGKALWWGIVTFMTVGYGDLTPLSTPGRIVASVMMLAGVVAIGIITAKISTVFLREILLEGRNAVDRSKVKDHLVICGWKDDMADLIRHVLTLTPGLSPKNIVLVASRSVEEMTVLKEEPGLKGLQVILGDHYQQSTLIKAAPELARKVLILADTTASKDGHKPSDSEADARTIMAAIALSTVAKSTVVAAELLDPSLDHYLKLAGVAEILYTREYSRLLLGNATSGAGITNVFHDLIDPNHAAHITTRQIPETHWGTLFGDFRRQFEQQNDALMVIGLLENTGNPHQIKERAFIEAQRTPDVAKLIDNLKMAKTLRCNKPVFNPKHDYKIPRGASAIILSGEGMGNMDEYLDQAHNSQVA